MAILKIRDNITNLFYATECGNKRKIAATKSPAKYCRIATEQPDMDSLLAVWVFDLIAKEWIFIEYAFVIRLCEFWE